MQYPNQRDSVSFHSMANKRPRLEDPSSHEQKIQRLVDELNALKPDRWFVCYDCYELKLYEPMECSMDKHNNTGLFCNDCVSYCEQCKIPYVEEMAYRHDDCKPPLFNSTNTVTPPSPSLPSQ